MLLNRKIFEITLNENEVRNISKALDVFREQEKQRLKTLQEKATKGELKNHDILGELQQNISELKTMRDQASSYVGITYYGD